MSRECQKILRIKFSTMKTTAVDERAITTIPCPSNPRMTATATPAMDDTILEVDLNTSGINIEVITANGI